ncbi:MAG: hypothetical protein DMD99_02310 [Candidatus Rokuibacteriota bacterium]|nr:MAG: hypothetical protein DMD99_02310 [Candidatus Rokubacteria bacterium]
MAYVYVGDQMVNAELVRRGYAQVMTIPPNVRHQDLFVKLQREARKQKRGQADRQSSGERRGVPPESTWTCRASQPIKGNFTTYSGERYIYHMSGGQFYSKTKPERCYATESEARQDGCRRSKR